MGQTVGIVGFGMIGHLHVQALKQIEGVRVIGGTDTGPGRTLSYRGRQRPVYRHLGDLLDRSPSAVIVATPTPTHAGICRALAAHGHRPRLVLMEKPLGSSLAEVDGILSPGPDMEVIGLYHAAHAPEVLWAMDRAPAWQETYGAFSGYLASFADPYSDRGAAHNQVYVNSWVDSGINALSVAYRFVQLTAVDQLITLDEQGSTFRASVRFGSNGRENAGTIETSWAVPDPVKHSALRLGQDTRLYLDHQQATGHLQHGDAVREEFIYTGTLPRLQMHYKNSFRSIFIDRKGYYTASESRLLHRLLFERTPYLQGRGGHRMTSASQDDAVSFARDIRPLFRPKDQESMRRAFDLFDYADVAAHADAIVAALRSGKMPCDGAWPDAQVATFQHWMDAGKPA
jgi:Oxidoreductase family, NAD-binding Rossmann fold